MKKKLYLLTICILSAAALCACGQTKKDELKPEADLTAFETPKDFEWEGSYMDDEEGLAVLVIEKDGKKYKCTVNVPDENITYIDTYEFTASEGDVGLSYKDGVRTTFEIPDYKKDPDAHVASTEAYNDGTGEIYYLNGRLYWIDDKDDSGSGFAFSRQEDVEVNNDESDGDAGESSEAAMDTSD